MIQWKLIFESIPIVPAYFPSCCDSAAASSDFSALSSESLGNPCACLAELVASGVLQETPSSIHAPAVSTFQPLTACTIFGFGVSAELQQRLSVSASSHLEMDFSTPVLSSWQDTPSFQHVGPPRSSPLPLAIFFVSLWVTHSLTAP